MRGIYEQIKNRNEEITNLMNFEINQTMRGGNRVKESKSHRLGMDTYIERKKRK